MSSSSPPIGFTVAKLDNVFAVARTLAAAVDAARKRSAAPTMVFEFEAWLEDGSRRAIPADSLMDADRQWISREQCLELERTLFGSRTVKEQVSELLRINQDADYWEKQVLRLAEAFLATVDEQLRGIPVAESGIEPMSMADFV